MNASVSFIQPMFHFIEKPSPPRFVGRVTPGHDVDSSAMVTMPGCDLVHGGVHLLQELHRLQVLPAAVDVRASSRPPGASSPGRASTRRRPPAGRRRGTPAASTARWPPGSCAPRRGRSRKRRCPSRVARRGGDRSARRAAVPSNRPSAHASFGKWAGTQSTMHADAGLVQRVDQVPEVVGCAEPRRRRVVGRDLVAPRSAERVLGDGQHLDVREALLDDVFGELARPVRR